VSWTLAGMLFVAWAIGVVMGVVASIAADQRYSGLDPVLKLFTGSVLLSYLAGAVFAFILCVAHAIR
jgi:hypothetical protein